jgi:ABC-type dipeptide/oligopeptide/nickel transport system permease component
MNRSTLLFVVRRVAVVLPQLLAVSLVTFVLVRMLPGNPARFLLGPHATPTGIERLSEQMGLDKPMVAQYGIYLRDLARGDLGRSWFTGQSVGEDLLDRAPATLELVTYAMLLAIAVGLLLGWLSAMRGGGGLAVRGVRWYTRLAGSFPDFWVALVAVFIFFYKLRIAPAPLGRLSAVAQPPPRITGFLTVDSLLAGDGATFVDAVGHLMLPVLVLGLIVAPMLAKIASASLVDAMRSDWMRYSKASGLPASRTYRYALRNSLPPVLTMIGILFVYLLGGAVLVEKVFSWGGMGQYAVQAVVNADYAAIQGFVLVAAAFTILVYLVVDLLHMAIDPRITQEG